VLVREGTREILAHQPDFAVVGETGDGLEAVRLIAGLRPDVAILDVRMPGLTAIEVIQQSRELGLPTHVLVLTAYDDDDFVVAALELGAQGYLLKTARAAESRGVLSPREWEVLQLAASGLRNREIADRLG